jgi:hypothetical protein
MISNQGVQPVASFGLKVPFIGEFFVETPSVTRGRRFVDHQKEGTSHLVWIGRLHAIFSPWSELRRLDAQWKAKRGALIHDLDNLVLGRPAG